MDAADRFIVNKKSRGEKPVQVEADDGVDAIIKKKTVPFADDHLLVGRAAFGIFLPGLGHRPADDAGIAADGGAAEA